MEGFRLSPQQKYLWLAQQTGQPQLYRAQAMVRLEGPLNPAALNTALQHIFNRHEILRTTFHQPAGFDLPLQVVGETFPLPVQHYQEQENCLDALFDTFGQQPLDLSQGPLWRVAWVTITPTQHILLMSLPALCADPMTLANLLYEISQGYATSLRGDFLTDDEPLQFAELAEWQNELLELTEMAAGRDFWHKQAWADSLNLKLPFEHPMAAGFNPRTLSLRLKPEVGELIETTAQTYGATPAVIWQSCWHMLLWRYSSQSEVLVGLATDGRTLDELKTALGPLARYVPVSSSLDESMSFAGLLTQLNEAVQAACQWQDFFQWEQADSLEPGFFPFSFEITPRIAPVTAGDVTFALERQVVHLSRFKAKLVVIPDKKRPAAELHYDASLFKQADMERLAGQLGELLASALAQPEMPIGQLNLLTPTEQQQLLVDFNRTETDSSDERCIHQLFEAQAARVPQRTAVVFEDEMLTYAELNRRANQLAHYLQTLGVGPDTLVAIFVERSLDMIVGMLGILKAGGAYVPFDPTLPKERLAFLLNDTQAPVLLTQSELQDRLPDPSSHLQRVVLDTDWAQIAAQPEHNPTSTVQNHHLVYVLFTSGSTGQPKGVMVEHRHLLNYIHGVTARLDLPAEANYATVSTFAADLGNTVIFPALCGGGCLHIITHERATDPDALAAYFHRYQVDCLKLVPSHLAALFASSRPEQIMPRQRLVLGGETSHWDLVKKAQALAPDCRIFNHYGPTETTVGVLTYPVSQALTAEAAYPPPATVPLGRPLANTQIYILDAAHQPVPVWVPGEVYIGGAGVARGYFNRPELTAERFVTNPFVKDEGGTLRVKDENGILHHQPSSFRLYRTGDLARYLPDGTIEFLGRIDNQVKIRGFRIELGEIEALLGQHPAVKETVVMAREDNPGDKRLVAYLIPTSDQTPTGTELRAFLKEKLPEPMLPTAFVLLDKLPLTSNGKINRRALPMPAPASMAFEETYLAPRNDIEEALTELWANMLGLERVGVRDNFFELGGHSLLAVRLIAQIQRWFGRDIPLATLFQEGTIERLAAVLSRQVDALPQSPLVKIQSGDPAKYPFFCVHPADGTVLSYVALARYLGEEQPFYGLQVAHLDESERPETRLKTMAAEYLAAVRTIQPEGPYWLGGWSMGGIVAFEMAQQLRQTGQSVALLALLDSWTPDSDPRYPAGYHLPTQPQPVGAELETQLLIDFLRHLRSRYAKELPPLPDDFRQLGPHEKLPYILEHAQMLEQVFPEGGLSQLHRLLQVFKANVRAMSSYVPQVYRGRIVLFQASEWFAAANHPHGQMPDSSTDWQRLSTEPLLVRSVPGDHYTMLAEPNIRVLAEQLKICLHEAELMGVTK